MLISASADSFLRKRPISVSHLPTVMLLVGYPVFWLELYCFRVPGGHTTLLAAVLSAFIGIWILFKKKGCFLPALRQIKDNWQRQSLAVKLFLVTGSFFAAVNLACGFYAALLPPHLIQEFDALNYHITLPRQHLILSSFKHIPWSTADLYLLPVDFALAPYWLVTELPNKFPQFLFLLGLAGVSVNLVRRFRKDNFAGSAVIVFAVLGSHLVGIQTGTAMLDIVIVYLLLASLDSFLNRAVFLCAAELTFYFWSKSFIPFQFLLILLGMIFLYYLFKKRLSWTLEWVKDYAVMKEDKVFLKKAIVIFLFLSAAVGGPFVAKSLYYAGTPLFPLESGLFKINRRIDHDSAAWRSLLQKSQMSLATRNQYGSGRSPEDFLRHLWLIAVPEEGVNNRYDYPVGLMYLLFLVPFLYFVTKAFREKRFAILPFFVLVYWFSWWWGSQQTRFLFIPILLMFIVVSSCWQKPTKTFMATMLIALALTSLSVLRAHYHDFGRAHYDVLREKDKELLLMPAGGDVQRPVTLDFFDAAFAGFAVDVVYGDSVFILKH